MLTIGKINKCWLCSRGLGIFFEFNLKKKIRKLCAKCAGLIIKVEQAEIKRTMKKPLKMLTFEEMEKDAMEAALIQGLNITDSAKALGITRATMYAKMEKYGITDRASTTGND